MKKALAIVLSIMLVLAITLPVAAISTIAVKSIKLNNSTITLKVGQTSNLKVTYTPANTSQKKLTYVTGNKKIATVDAVGKITGVSKGTTTITVYTLDKKVFAKCKVTISQLAKEVTIKFPCIWVAKDSKAKVFGEMVNAFNTENKGTIKVLIEEITDYQAYRDKIRTVITAGYAPDIFTFDSMADLKLFAKSGKLIDFTNILTGDWKNTFASGIIDNSLINGKIIGIPYESGVTPVLYNAKLLKEVGYNEFPKTYTELWVMCDKLKAKGIIPIAQMTGGGDAWTSMLWYSQALQAIGGPNVLMNGYDDPAFVEAAKIMQKLYKYTSSDAVGAAAAIPAGHFLNERAAVLMNGPWFIGRIKKEGINNLYDNVKVAPAPAFEGGKGQPGGYVGAVQAFIGAAKQKDSAKQEAEIKFIKFITDPSNVANLSASSGALFYVKTEMGANADRLQSEMNKQAAAAPYVAYHLKFLANAPVSQAFPNILSSLVLGEITPEQFVAKLKEADKQ